jgi:hypothetical protein
MKIIPFRKTNSMLAGRLSAVSRRLFAGCNKCLPAEFQKDELLSMNEGARGTIVNFLSKRKYQEIEILPTVAIHVIKYKVGYEGEI